MGPARSIKTKDWNYVALRYTTEQIEAIRSKHRSVKQLMGLSGGVSRARVHRDAFDTDLIRRVDDRSPVPVIASGGVGTLDHLADGVTLGGADAVLAASIFHFGEHTVAEAKEHLARRGITVRPA